MKIHSFRSAGFTLVEIMIVVAIIGLLAAIAVPNFVQARGTSQKHSCINNLRQLDSAVQQWALENGKPDNSDSTVAEALIYNYLKQGIALKTNCPGGGSYSLPTAVTNSPSCSLSASQKHLLK